MLTTLHRARPNDLQRDWQGMAWTATGDGSYVATSGGWNLRAILKPVGRAWQVLIDGTPCRTADGATMAWPDVRQAGWQAHEFLQLDFAGPAFRARLPFSTVPRDEIRMRPCDYCRRAPCKRPSRCIAGALASPTGFVVMDANLREALQTVDGRAVFHTEVDAVRANQTEVVRWLSLP